MLPALPTEWVKQTVRIIIKLLFYLRDVDKTFPVPLRKMATKREPIEQDEENVHQFLDYMATYPNAVIRFTLQTWFYVPTPMRHIWLNRKHSLLRKYTFLGSIPSKCERDCPNGQIHVKQYFKICCCLCSRSRNQGLFRDRRIFNHSTKHIRINGPPTSH